MSEVTIGSLFSGAGALCELAVAPLFGGRVAWHCEFEPPTKKRPKPSQAGARMLAHRFPGTPNLGDIRVVNWNEVEPVDVLAYGFPCQDISAAGRRAGIGGTRSGLWSYTVDAIRVLRPRLVLVENVAALVVRGLDRVLADLASLGFDAEWAVVRASDVGAPHRRERLVLAAANPASTRRGPLQPVHVSGHCREAHGPRQAESRRCRGATAHADDLRSVRSGLEWNRGAESAHGGEGHLLPTPRATDGTHGGPNQRGSSGDLMLPSAVASLLPTPTARDWKGQNQRGDDTCLAGVLLPTPTAGRYGNNQSASDGAAVRPSLDTLAPDLVVEWGPYDAAIKRWAGTLGRPAPHPTITGARGGRKLNPALVEWMMGWPAGWVTDVPGLTANEQLRLCGNGVVPSQIIAAGQHLIPLLASERRAA